MPGVIVLVIKNVAESVINTGLMTFFLVYNLRPIYFSFKAKIMSLSFLFAEIKTKLDIL